MQRDLYRIIYIKTKYIALLAVSHLEISVGFLFNKDSVPRLSSFSCIEWYCCSLSEELGIILAIELLFVATAVKHVVTFYFVVTD